MTDTREGFYTNYSYAPATVQATAWQVVHRPDSGHFIQTMGGVSLCRVGNGNVYFWDKKARAEICISLEQLARIAG